MDAAQRTVVRITTADLQHKTNGKRSVGFIRKEVRVSAIEIADEFLRPMTLLAGLLRRTQVLDGCSDRTMILAGEDTDELVNAIDLRFHVSRSARADGSQHILRAHVAN